MFKNRSDNAVMAKVHALYGKRLSNENYEQLLQKTTVGEIAAYLKNETYFSESMREVNEERIHRGQLEQVVRKHSLDLTMRLMRYSQNDDFVLQMYVARNEIYELLSAIRLLNANAMDRYIAAFPAYLSKHMDLDLFEIAACKDFDDLLQSVSNTRYYAMLARFRPQTREQPVDVASCEAALLTQFYSLTLNKIEKEYRGNTRSDLKDLLHHQIDLHNITVMYRLKRFFSAQPDQITAYMLPIPAKISNRMYQKMIETSSLQQFIDIVKQIRFFRHAPLDLSGDTGQVSAQIYKMQRKLSEKTLRFSQHPVVVLVSFMMLVSIEVNDITNIIEGVRYKVPSHEIRSLLAI